MFFGWKMWWIDLLLSWQIMQEFCSQCEMCSSLAGHTRSLSPPPVVPCLTASSAIQPQPHQCNDCISLNFLLVRSYIHAPQNAIVCWLLSIFLGCSPALVSCFLLSFVSPVQRGTWMCQRLCRELVAEKNQERWTPNSRFPTNVPLSPKFCPPSPTPGCSTSLCPLCLPASLSQ